jgi:hypothetical protein
LTENTIRSTKNRSIIRTVSGPTKERVSFRKLPPIPIRSTCGASEPPTIVMTGSELVKSVTGMPVSRISRTT